MTESSKRKSHQSDRLYHSCDDEAHHIQCHPSTSITFTPPLTRASSNTFGKFGKKKKKAFSTRHASSGDCEAESGNSGRSRGKSPLSSSPKSFTKMGVVVTSSRQAGRRWGDSRHMLTFRSMLDHCRSSSSTAALAFAVAIAGSSNPRDRQDQMVN